MASQGIENAEIRKVVHDINNELTKVTLLAEELLQNNGDGTRIKNSAGKIVAAAHVAAVSGRRLMKTLQHSQAMAAGLK